MSGDPKTQKETPIQLDSNQSDREVVITPFDEDRFVMSCKSTIEACIAHTSEIVWRHELRVLIDYVKEWASQNKDQVRSCYVAPRDGQIVIFIVPTSGSYDFDLADKITDLDLKIAEKCQACPCDMMQIPADSLETYVDLKHAMKIYGPSSGPQGQVET